MSKTYKKIEVVGISSESASDAVSRAIEKASETVHNLGWFEVIEHRGKIKDGKVHEHQVTVKIGFRLD